MISYRPQAMHCSPRHHALTQRVWTRRALRRCRAGSSLWRGRNRRPCVASAAALLDLETAAFVRRGSSAVADLDEAEVVQEDVGQERADARPLRRSPVHLVPLAALQSVGRAPLPDKAQDARVDDPMREIRRSRRSCTQQWATTWLIAGSSGSLSPSRRSLLMPGRRRDPSR